MKITLVNPDMQELDYFPEQFGEYAGVCYMNKSFDEIVRDSERCIKRFEETKAKGHHSVAEHNHLTLLIEGTSKLFAMLLNSVRAYNTSEKSGRYTKIGVEDKNYTKWYDKIKEYLISKGIPENEAVRTASENARMQLSVLHKGTTFVYTTSYRMLGYLVYYCKALAKKLKGTVLEDTDFGQELEEFADFIKDRLGIDYQNNKPSELDFILDTCSVAKQNMLLEKPVVMSEGIYTYVCNMSFTAVAQAERHRTLKCNIFLGKQEHNRYYIPFVIAEMGLEEEWLQDIKAVKLPQGMRVVMVERGCIEDFVLKCQERLCMRAQEEIRTVTMQEVKDLYEYGSDLTKEYMRDCGLIKQTDKGYRVATKCEMLKCNEPCGKVSALINF